MLIVVVLSMLAFIGPPFRTVTPTSPAGLALAGDDIITCMKKTNYVLNKIKSQKQINNYTIISRTRLKPLHVFFFFIFFFSNSLKNNHNILIKFATCLGVKITFPLFVLAFHLIVLTSYLYLGLKWM